MDVPVSRPFSFTRGRRKNLRENTHFHHCQLWVPGLHIHLVPRRSGGGGGGGSSSSSAMAACRQRSACFAACRGPCADRECRSGPGEAKALPFVVKLHLNCWRGPGYFIGAVTLLVVLDLAVLVGLGGGGQTWVSLAAGSTATGAWATPGRGKQAYGAGCPLTGRSTAPRLNTVCPSQ